MVSTACPIDSKDFSRRCLSMLQSFSIASNESTPRNLQRCASGLTHGLQMDLQQAVQLEKQELEKMGLLPRPMEVEMTLAAILPFDDEDRQVHMCSSSPLPYWLHRRQVPATSFSRGHCGDGLPCSPPVPIPQHHQTLQDNLPYGYFDADPLEDMSSSQCEVQRCDKFWNYSRSSFELQGQTSSDEYPLDRTAGMSPCSDSMLQLSRSVATDLVHDDEDDEALDDARDPDADEGMYHYGDVFEMEDL
ncbi:unnamed protein product [Hyaloperonospora brassicae]|uniref:Uncharacterized protein n=1 Tax=Hyaloperonospora brassicae TaxID=162125 RepID=A0AAV0TKQ4_HYABA|nr:unnamed protein product [Hyaloperonospora brassicae]